MSNGIDGNGHGDPGGGPGRGDETAARPRSEAPEPERLDRAECLRLISPGGVGRLAYSGRFGLTVLPVNYVVHEGDIVFRTVRDSATDEDLRTGIADAEYRVAFEIDDVDPAAREGWSVLVRGALHRVETDAEHTSLLAAGVEPWAGGVRELFMRISPTEISGRRVRRA